MVVVLVRMQQNRKFKRDVMVSTWLSQTVSQCVKFRHACTAGSAMKTKNRGVSDSTTRRGIGTLFSALIAITLLYLHIQQIFACWCIKVLNVKYSPFKNIDSDDQDWKGRAQWVAESVTYVLHEAKNVSRKKQKTFQYVVWGSGKL